MVNVDRGGGGNGGGNYGDAETIVREAGAVVKFFGKIWSQFCKPVADNVKMYKKAKFDHNIQCTCTMRFKSYEHFH